MAAATEPDSPKPLGLRLAAAQKAMGGYLGRETLTHAAQFQSEEIARPLNEAARAFLTIAMDMQSAGEPVNHTRSVLILSVCAFAMAANFTECHHVLESHDWIAINCNDLEAAALAVCQPTLAAGFMEKPPADPAARQFLEQWMAFTSNGTMPEIAFIAQIDTLSQSKTATNADVIFLMASRLAAAHQKSIILTALVKSPATI